MPAIIDLDHNATTQIAPEVAEVVAKCWRDGYANPGSRHAPGRRARQILEDSRESIASHLGAFPDEVIFTSGGTEANNLAVLGLARGARGCLALTAGEHPSVIEAARWLEAAGWVLRWLPVDATGKLMIGPVEDDLRFATAILAHNETGVIQDLAPLLAETRRLKIPLHSDAVQAVGKLPVNFHALGVASLSCAAHKFHGPRGIGALLLGRGWKLAPIAFGGHQESERRPGTEVVPLAAGMARALELFENNRATRTSHVAQLRDKLQEGLCARAAPVVINGVDAPRLGNTLNISFPGTDGEALLVSLDLAGIACSLGSTCASGSIEPAPALLAMGCAPEVYKSAVRLSLGIDNTEEEIDRAIDIIARTVARLRALQDTRTPLDAGVLGSQSATENA